MQRSTGDCGPRHCGRTRTSLAHRPASGSSQNRGDPSIEHPKYLTPITHLVTLIIPIITPITKSPDPPSIIILTIGTPQKRHPSFWETPESTG